MKFSCHGMVLVGFIVVALACYNFDYFIMAGISAYFALITLFLTLFAINRTYYVDAEVVDTKFKKLDEQA